MVRGINNLLPTGKSKINNDMPSSNYASFNTNKQASFKQIYIAANNSSGSKIAYNNYSNINNYSSLTNSLTKHINVDSNKMEVQAHPLRIAKKDIKGVEHRINLSKSRSNRSSSMSNSKSIPRHKNKKSSEKKFFAFDENRENTITSMNQDDQNKDVDMDIDEDKMPLVGNQAYELPVLSPKTDMEIDMEISKPQTDQEKLNYFNEIIIKNQKESLHQVDIKTYDDPLQ